MRVLAEHGPRCAQAPGRARHLDRHAELLDARCPGLIELDDHLACPHELRFERLVQVEHWLEAAVVLRGELAPLLARALEEQALDLRVRLRARRLELLLDQVLAPNALAPR